MKGETQSLQGTVKSFSTRDEETGKGGYGFIECAEVGVDVWFGRRDLAQEVYEAVQNRILSIKDREVTFGVTQKDDGKPQANRVQLVATLNEKLPGRVRSYNGGKGFGFFVCSSLEGQDVYFQRKELPPAQQGIDLPPNTLGSFTLTQTADGKLQAKEVQIVVTPAMMGAMGAMHREMQAPMPGPMAMQMPFAPRPMPTMRTGGFPRGPPAMAPSMMAAPPPPLMHRSGPPAGMFKAPANEKAGLTGKVKAYFAEKGFGFITSPAHPQDIYFKGGGGMYEAGMPVTFTMTITQDGKPQAKQIAAGLEEGQTLEGTVRSYSPGTGYGFITAADIGADVYFKGTVVPPEQQDGNYIGRHARFVVKLTQDGKPQVSELMFLDEARGFKRGLPEPAAAPLQASRPRPTWVPARQQLK
mmetsp:Transcript_34378/g.78339  ORF Transcript_34378/g.78339 Transcript_34378/m.78339 type:complete len:413 (+) Transcript_34378:51-1289(+)